MQTQNDTNCLQDFTAVTHVGSIFGEGRVRQLPDLLAVHLRGAAVVLGVGVVGGAPVLTEESGLQRGRNTGALGPRGDPLGIATVHPLWKSGFRGRRSSGQETGKAAMNRTAEHRLLQSSARMGD